MSNQIVSRRSQNENSDFNKGKTMKKRSFSESHQLPTLALPLVVVLCLAFSGVIHGQRIDVANAQRVLVTVSVPGDDLKYTESDCIKVATAFRESAPSGVSTIVIPLHDTPRTDRQFIPNRMNILRVWEERCRAMSGNSNGCLIFFASLHGCEINGVAYLVTVDANLSDPDNTMVRVDELVALVKRYRVPNAMIVADSCRNQGVEQVIRFKSVDRGDVFKLKASMPIYDSDLLSSLAGQSNTLVIMSCSSGEQAIEIDGYGSLFAKYFAEGLTDPKAARDGIITASSLYEYVYKKVVADAKRLGHEQNPEFLHGNINTGGFELARVSIAPRQQDDMLSLRLPQPASQSPRVQQPQPQRPAQQVASQRVVQQPQVVRPAENRPIANAVNWAASPQGRSTINGIIAASGGRFRLP